MIRYSSVSIIYNPNSTGASKSLAQALKRDLTELLPGQTVTLVATKHAGHGEKLAYELAMATKRPLIISSSGDGGYHEVVNGLMRAQTAGARPIAGLLPAGNANDHYHNLHTIDTSTAIKRGKSLSVDLLKLVGTADGKTYERYAHSYIGIGLTPKVGQELNKTVLNRFNQVWIVLKSLLVLQPVQIIVGGKRRSYDSLIFSNVGKMSKVLSLSKYADMTDGKFEVTAFRRHTKLRLLMTLLHASTKGLTGDRQVSNYGFKTLKQTIVQLDGEIMTLDAKTDSGITIEPKVLEIII